MLNRTRQAQLDNMSVLCDELRKESTQNEDAYWKASSVLRKLYPRFTVIHRKKNEPRNQLEE